MPRIREGELEASLYCPFCHRHTSVTPTRARITTDISTYVEVPIAWSKRPAEKWWIGACNHCKEAVLVLNQGERVYPPPVPEPTDSRVPEEIRKDVDEAKRCLWVDAYRGCAVLARRAIQSSCLREGAAKDKKLHKQVDELHEKGVITLKMKAWADSVRWVGNDGAHPGGEPVSIEDAEDILKLAEQFMNVLYVTPGIAAEQRQKRKKSKTSPAKGRNASK